MQHSSYIAPLQTWAQAASVDGLVLLSPTAARLQAQDARLKTPELSLT